MVADLEKQLATMSFPIEYHAEVIAKTTADEIGIGRAIGFAIGAAIAALLLFQAAFNSWRLALVATAALPLSLTGGLITGLFSGLTFGLGSLLGLLAILGLAARYITTMLATIQGPDRRRTEDDDADTVLRQGPGSLRLHDHQRRCDCSARAADRDLGSSSGPGDRATACPRPAGRRGQLVDRRLVPAAIGVPAPDSASSGGGTAGARGRAATGRRSHRGVIIMSTKSRLRTVRHSVLGLVLAAAVGFSLAGCAEIEVGVAEPYEPARLESTGPSQPAEDHPHRRGNAPSCAPDNGRRSPRRRAHAFITVPSSMTRRVCRGSSQSLGPGPTSVRRSPSNMSRVTLSR